jgi:hypothetical protein
MEPTAGQEQEQPKQNSVRVFVNVRGKGMGPYGKVSNVTMNVYGGFLKPSVADELLDKLVSVSASGAKITAGPGGCSSSVVPDALAQTVAESLRQVGDDPDNFESKSSHKFKSGVIDDTGRFSVTTSQR